MNLSTLHLDLCTLTTEYGTTAVMIIKTNDYICSTFNMFDWVKWEFLPGTVHTKTWSPKTAQKQKNIWARDSPYMGALGYTKFHWQICIRLLKPLRTNQNQIKIWIDWVIHMLKVYWPACNIGSFLWSEFGHLDAFTYNCYVNYMLKLKWSVLLRESLNNSKIHNEHLCYEISVY